MQYQIDSSIFIVGSYFGQTKCIYCYLKPVTINNMAYIIQMSLRLASYYSPKTNSQIAQLFLNIRIHSENNPFSLWFAVYGKFS